MNQPNGISRKRFLQLGLLGGLGAMAGWLGWRKWKSRPISDIPVQIVGANHQRGHQLREGKFPPITQKEKAEIVIIGGGIAGLAAAWKLRKAGIDNLVVLELEDQPGGNSRFGQGSGPTPFPWGAHYLPVPNPSNRDLIDFLQDIGVVTGFENSLPVYNPYYLCADPRERLKIFGKWQYGLLPKSVTATEKSELDAFHAYCESLEETIGKDGLPIFNLPVETSSRDPEYLALNEISMAQFLQEKGWQSTALLWYVEYCCRDDYGTDLANTSAWAGLHYFASRTGFGANAPEDAILTWPEGNGFLARALYEPLGDRLKTGAVVWSVIPSSESVSISYIDSQSGQSVELESQKAILALPGFIRQRLLPQTLPLSGPQAHYSPWAIANIHVNQRPTTGNTQLCWDNVAYQSPSLGYVVSDHQVAQGFPPASTTLTWYLPLSHLPPAQARNEALQRPPEEWRTMVLEDLEKMHPGISDTVTGIDIWLWGHGMIAPIPGYLFHPDRVLESAPQGNLHFAHSDLSGISIFEEAFYQGLRAAREIIAAKA